MADPNDLSALDYGAFLATLEQDRPPLSLGPALRALWYDAKGRDDSAERAANSDESHACLRVRAYLARKRGDAHATRRNYWLSGTGAWEGSLESEWEDIVRSILVEVVVERSYL